MVVAASVKPVAHSIELLLVVFTISVGSGVLLYRDRQQMGQNSLSAVWIKLSVWLGYKRVFVRAFDV